MLDYVFEVKRCAYEKEKNVFTILCNSATDRWGEEIMLHNEIDIIFKIKDGKIYILEGMHIGTESYELDEGDDYTLERYHPGITEQILDKMKEEGFI